MPFGGTDGELRVSGASVELTQESASAKLQGVSAQGSEGIVAIVSITAIVVIGLTVIVWLIMRGHDRRECSA